MQRTASNPSSVIRSVVRAEINGNVVAPEDDGPSSRPAMDRLIDATAWLKEEVNTYLSAMVAQSVNSAAGSGTAGAGSSGDSKAGPQDMDDENGDDDDVEEG